jgi:molybdenum cofactor cytidylyltransferase
MIASAKIGLIVLAAGLSRRMGGPNKLLRPYRGAPLLAHALSAVHEIDFAARVVVTGRDAGEIEKVAASYGFRCVHNARYMEGLGTSIAAGSLALSPDVDALFVALSDMPHIAASDYLALASKLEPRAIAAPVYAGARGHPVLFCASYLGELGALAGDEGARALLKRHAPLIIHVKTENPGVLRDIDTPQDFSDCPA